MEFERRLCCHYLPSLLTEMPARAISIRKLGGIDFGRSAEVHASFLHKRNGGVCHAPSFACEGPIEAFDVFEVVRQNDHNNSLAVGFSILLKSLQVGNVGFQ